MLGMLVVKLEPGDGFSCSSQLFTSDVKDNQQRYSPFITNINDTTRDYSIHEDDSLVHYASRCVDVFGNKWYPTPDIFTSMVTTTTSDQTRHIRIGTAHGV